MFCFFTHNLCSMCDILMFSGTARCLRSHKTVDTEYKNTRNHESNMCMLVLFAPIQHLQSLVSTFASCFSCLLAVMVSVWV